MKKVLLLVLLVVVVGGAFYFSQGSMTSSSSTDGSDTQATASQTNSSSSSSSSMTPVGGSVSFEDSEDNEGLVDYDDRPAAEIYKTSEEAIKAIQSGAKDYDDIILEQFTEPGEDCTWCDSFYSSITDMMKSTKDEDEKAYYSEVLAISGKVGHVKTLIEAIEEAGNSEDADIYAESLEFTIGGDDVVETLKGYFESENELLQEASVAAVTNQGSKFAAETLYEHTVATGDPDGYYDIGIGLGEMIPEEETLPYLQELVMKKDDYSHLAFKALLNYGHDGLVIVMDTLTNSQTPDIDKKMLEDAIDHVSYEDESEVYLKKIVESSKSPLVVEFAQEILEDYSAEEDEEEEL